MTSRTPSIINGEMASLQSPDGQPRRHPDEVEGGSYLPRHVNRPTAIHPFARDRFHADNSWHHDSHVVRGQSLDTTLMNAAYRSRHRVTDPGASDEALRKRQLEGLQVLFSLANATAVTDVQPPVSSTRSRAKTRDSRVLLHFKDPALRGAMALILSAVLSGGLGFVFWAATAHYQKASGVGSISAEVSAITFLASVGSLNLINVFARFLPEAGRHARRLIIVSYSAAALAGSLGALIFLLTPLSSGLVIGGGFGKLAFSLCVVMNSIFVIQDGGLVGFGRSAWVPIENVLVASLRLALLPLAIRSLSAPTAILWSWALPMAISVLVVNALILGRLAGRRQMLRRPRLPPFRELSRFIAIESVTTAISAAVSALLPALITRRLGTTQGGYFYVPWIITTMVSLLLTSILISMVREAVARPEKATFTIRRSLGLVLLMMTAGMIGCFFMSGLVLAPMGSEFVEHGVPLLRWVGLALPAMTINLFYWALCLVRRRPWPVFAVNLSTSAMIIGGVLLLRHSSDISHVGMIYCLAQWIVAVVAAIPTIRTLRVLLERQ